MNLRRRLLQQLAAASLLGLACLGMASAQAQDFPSKPLKFVVPFPPGSGTDTSARYFAKKFTEITGQTVVVDNKPGANANIAEGAVLSPSRKTRYWASTPRPPMAALGPFTPASMPTSPAPTPPA